MDFVIRGLESFTKKACAIDAQSGLRLKGYVRVRAGLKRDGARVVERVNNVELMDDRALFDKISEIIQGLCTQYVVFLVEFMETGEEDPSVTLAPACYPGKYEPPQEETTAINLFDEKERDHRRNSDGAAAMALAQISLDTQRKHVDTHKQLVDAWIHIGELREDLKSAEFEVKIYKLISGVEKWDKAAGMLKTVIDGATPHIPKALDGMMELIKMKAAEADAEKAKAEAAKTASQAERERLNPGLARSEEERLDEAIDFAVSAFTGPNGDGYITMARAGKLSGIAQLFQAKFQPKG